MNWRARIVPERAGPLLLGGVLMGLAHPPFHLLVTSFVALVPFIVWLEGLPATAEGRRQARKGGFLFGLVYYTLVLYWLLVALVFYTWWAFFAFLAPILILATFMSWVAGGIHLVRARFGWPLQLVFPVFWTAGEVLRAHLLDVSFPWMQLGDTLSAYPVLVGAADLVGSRGLSFWLALANALVASGFLAYRAGGWRALRRPAAGLLLVLALPIAYSVARWQTLEVRPAARVGVVQPNVPQHLRNTDRAASTDSAFRSTATLISAWPGRERMDLVIFPETMLAGRFMDSLPSFDYPGWPDARNRVTGIGEMLDAEVAVGGVGAADLGNPEYQPYNSAYHFRPGEGIVNRYDKRFLVPFVERVPFMPPAWFQAIPYAGGNFGIGEWQAPVEVATEDGSAAYGTMICYESIFSPLARHYRRNGADFLVNITNDSWFGRDAWWSRSSALWQHPAHLVMRSIETRMGAARSGNTGISKIVDPLGRVSHRTELFAPASFVADVSTTDELTVYVRLGDVVGTLAALAALLALGASFLKDRTRRGRAPRSASGETVDQASGSA
ncbi:apolipoprotein N-acyltransferase [Candidatus Palauibacter irciniicola]|uniref:apolipoprotein N-acyltransferase n=1 Tax=Candidatus Palauibacter irciniicola TaxID=3056733 RepID=UPI003B02B483